MFFHVFCQTCFISSRLYKIVAVMAFFWARVLYRLAVEDARFRMRITLGVVLIRSLAFTQCVPRRLQSGSGVALK